MEFLRRILNPKDYNPWLARKDENEHTHYDKDHIHEAMAILSDSRAEINDTVSEYSEGIDEYVKNGISHHGISRGTWEIILAQKLIHKFIVDHEKIGSGFNEKAINKEYPDICHFFRDVNHLIQNEYYPAKLKKIKTSPITKDDLSAGWTAIISEYGLFGATSTLFDVIMRNILDTSGQIKIENVISISDSNLDRRFFEIAGYKCPAQLQVRNHIGLCVALNIGLIKNGIYSKESRISLLDDKTRHFKKREKMIEEFTFLSSKTSRSRNF